MPLKIPESGLNIHQATDVISGILSSGNEPAPTEERAEPAETAVEEPPAETAQVEERAEPAETAVEEPPAETAQVEEPQTTESAESVKQESQQPSETDEIEIDQGVLAEFLGVKSADLVLNDSGVAIKAKVDGKVSEVPLKELKDSYQLTNAAQQRMEKLAIERKEFEEKRKTSLEEIDQQQQFMGQAIQAMEQQYASDWQQTDWNRLREEDPDNYLLKRQDYDEKLKQVGVFKQQLIEAHEKMQTEKQEKLKEKWQEGFLKLQEVFTSDSYMNAPEWNDDERSKLSVWMSSNGFTQDDMRSVTSWHVFKWARDSMLREREQKNAKAAVKRVAKLPKLKVTKPGAKQAKSAPKRTAIEEAKTKQRKAAKLGGRSNLKETVNLIEAMFKKG